LRGAIRLRHYSRQTEETYVQWYKPYVLFQKEAGGVMRHPAEMGAAEVEAFLTHLAVNRDLSASSQNQALNALVFLYHEVLKVNLEGIKATRAKRNKRLPVVLTQGEVSALLQGVRGDAGLAVRLPWMTLPPSVNPLSPKAYWTRPPLMKSSEELPTKLPEKTE